VEYDQLVKQKKAAIGLVNGTTCSPWRTRHLRIRASILREATEDTDADGGGLWRLLHLKGSELVADGLTKQLNGQAFFRFVEDLGIKKATSTKSVGPQPDHARDQHGRGDAQTAMKAIMVGSLLMSSAKAMEEEDTEKDDMTPIFATGAVLMALGAVYAGQLIYKVSQCCLKRLQAPGDSEVPSDRVRGKQHECKGENATTVSEDKSAAEGMSVRSSRGSGSGEQTGSGPMPTSSLRVRTRSGAGGASSLTLPSGSGSRAMVSGATTKTMTSQSGRSSASCDEAAGSATRSMTCDERADGGSTSFPSRTQSGSSNERGTTS